MPQAVALSFWQSATTIYGLPEREDISISLQNTEGVPYEFFNVGDPDHLVDRRNPMYGSIPYITGLATTHIASLLWVNSAHSYVNILDYAYS